MKTQKELEEKWADVLNGKMGDISKAIILDSEERWEDVSLLMKEVEELYARLEAWQKCADRLFVYAEEIQCTVVNRALWEVACEDVAEYKKLKNETQSNE
jgi:hypothetical protein